jgi:hypothetical protein
LILNILILKWHSNSITFRCNAICFHWLDKGRMVRTRIGSLEVFEYLMTIFCEKTKW